MTQDFQPKTINSLTNYSWATSHDDSNRPFTFNEWLARTTFIKKGFEKEEYKKYLNAWSGAKTETDETTRKIKKDYIAFIKSLSKFLSKEDQEKFDDDFKLDNLMNLEQIIPYCAEKLKDIMQYYHEKRISIANAKLKYNLVGSEQAIERTLHEYILKAYTKRGSAIKLNDSELYETLPELKDINTNLEITVNELYDDTEYFDKNPNATAEYYYGKPSEKELEFYKELGYSEDEVDWLLSCGFNKLNIENPFVDIATESTENETEEYNSLYDYLEEKAGKNLPLSAYVNYDKTKTVDYFQKELTKKYIGSDVYSISGGYYENQYLDITYDLLKGNNWMFFPSGENSYEIPAVATTPLYISASQLLQNEGAIGADNYKDADKIFVQYGNTVKGAWLKDTTIHTSPSSMVCNIYANKPYTFKFPYCDYGVSGEGIQWKGIGIDNSDQTFLTLPEADQKNILNEYWNSSGNPSAEPVRLQYTTLADCGAVAAINYKDADKIHVKNITGATDNVKDGVFNAEMQDAFLYKFTSSDIPVRPGKNYISWPLQNTTIDGRIDVPNDICNPTNLSDIDTTKLYGSRAGYDMFDSDLIYKLDGPNGHPVECAWLKGTPFTDLSAMKDEGWTTTTWTKSATGCFQAGMFLKCYPGNYVTFMWLDEDTPMDDVVFHIDHQPDCPYLSDKKFSLYENHPDTNEDPNVDFKSWQHCSCGSIIYSPFGHPGKSYDDYTGCADICFADTLFPLPFNKSTWFSVDRNGNTYSYKDSDQFGWYQLTGTDNVEPDIGWGKGHWITENGSKFILKKGIQYKYYRTNIGHQTSDIVEGTIAPVYITHKQSDKVLKYTKPVWKKAIADENGDWNKTDMDSDMVIYPNSTIVYDHIESNWYCITALGTFGEYETSIDIDPNNGPENEDAVAYTPYTHLPVSSITSAIWPSRISNLMDIRYPIARDIDLLRWEVKYSDTGSIITKTIPPSEPLPITMYASGSAEVSVSAYTSEDKIVSETIENITTSHTERMQTPIMIGSGDSTSAVSATFNIYFESSTTITATSGTRGIETIRENTIGFPLNTQLSGWDYDTKSRSTENTQQSALGAKPFWASASNESNSTTRFKGYPTWGGDLRLVEDYIPITQPPVSNIIISAFNPVTYETSNPFCWTQTVNMVTDTRDRRWCNLEIETTNSHVLSSEFKNHEFRPLVVKQTDDTSNIYLQPKIDGDPIQINYWANSDFTWNDTVQDITNGMAPTGGKYIQDEIRMTTSAYAPFANMSNRHYPTIAVSPVIDNLYNKKDVGGYDLPQNLGASTTVAKDIETRIIVENRTSADNGEIIRNPSTFTKDTGFSMTDNNVNMELTLSDPRWMKTSIGNGVNTGFIKNPKASQQFMPYRSTYEKTNVGDVGIQRPKDIRDPWSGDTDTTWTNELFKKHFTNQEPISAYRHNVYNVGTLKIIDVAETDNFTLTNQCVEEINSIVYITTPISPVDEQHKTDNTVIAAKINEMYEKTKGYCKYKLTPIDTSDEDLKDKISSALKIMVENIKYFYAVYNVSKEDLYGYSYSLVKQNYSYDDDIYKTELNIKRNATGNVVVRDEFGNIRPLKSLITAIDIDKSSTLTFTETAREDNNQVIADGKIKIVLKNATFAELIEFVRNNSTHTIYGYATVGDDEIEHVFTLQTSTEITETGIPNQSRYDLIHPTFGDGDMLSMVIGIPKVNSTNRKFASLSLMYTYNGTTYTYGFGVYTNLKHFDIENEKYNMDIDNMEIIKNRLILTYKTTTAPAPTSYKTVIYNLEYDGNSDKSYKIKDTTSNITVLSHSYNLIQQLKSPNTTVEDFIVKDCVNIHYCQNTNTINLLFLCVRNESFGYAMASINTLNNHISYKLYDFTSNSNLGTDVAYNYNDKSISTMFKPIAEYCKNDNEIICMFQIKNNDDDDPVGSFIKTRINLTNGSSASLIMSKS